jgi:hypothetical protein
MPSIPELQEKKRKLERQRDLISSLMAFVGAVLVVGYFLFGRGNP